jgi:hypothetical protein
MSDILAGSYDLKFLGWGCSGKDNLGFIAPTCQNLVACLLAFLESFSYHIAMDNDSIGFGKSFLGRVPFLLEVLVGF